MREQEESLNHIQKNMLQSAYENTPIPPSMELKTIQQLYDKQLLHRKNNPAWIKVAFSIVVAGLIFLAGFLIGNNSLSKNNLTASNEKKQYLLLLHNTPEFKESPEHVKEYGDWMRGLIASGNGATGNELADGGWSLSGNGNTQNNFTASGFFIIEAANDEEAMDIAKSCPHIKHKGNIEIRRMVQH